MTINSTNPINLDVYPEDIREPLRHLHGSLEEAVRALLSIKESISSGTYTREEAEDDLEYLTWEGGIDIHSALAELVANGSESW